MKKFAHIVDNLVNNIAKFKDNASPPTQWIDITGIQCGIGWPIVGGVPLAPPSKWHTVTATNDGWEITPENQALKDAEEAAQNPTNAEIFDKTIQNFKLIKGLVLSLNDGSFVAGSNYTNAQIKTIITAKM